VSALITVWSTEGDVPTEGQCEVFGYPHRTVTGATMYVNTHFLTLDDAWARCATELESMLTHRAQRLEDARRAVRVAESECAEAGVRMARFIEARRAHVEAS